MKDVAARYNVSVNTVSRVFSIVQYQTQKLPKVLSLDEFKGNSGGNKHRLTLADPAKGFRYTPIARFLETCRKRYT